MIQVLIPQATHLDSRKLPTFAKNGDQVMKESSHSESEISDPKSETWAALTAQPVVSPS